MPHVYVAAHALQVQVSESLLLFDPKEHVRLFWGPVLGEDHRGPDDPVVLRCGEDKQKPATRVEALGRFASTK
jgi:hypothetical protein